MFCASILRPFKQSCVYTFKKRIYGYTIYTYILYIRRKIVGQQKHLVIAEACNATLTTWQLLFETRSPSVGTWSKALRLRQAPSRSRWIVYLVTEADGWFLLDGRFIAMDGYKIQLTEVVAPMIYRVCTCLYGIPGSAGFLIINSMHIMYFMYIYIHINLQFPELRTFWEGFFSLQNKMEDSAFWFYLGMLPRTVRKGSGLPAKYKTAEKVNGLYPKAPTVRLACHILWHQL